MSHNEFDPENPDDQVIAGAFVDFWHGVDCSWNERIDLLDSLLAGEIEDSRPWMVSAVVCHLAESSDNLDRLGAVRAGLKHLVQVAPDQAYDVRRYLAEDPNGIVRMETHETYIRQGHVVARTNRSYCRKK